MMVTLAALEFIDRLVDLAPPVCPAFWLLSSPSFLIRFYAGTTANVRFGSLADIGGHWRHVRSTPESGPRNSIMECLLCAKSGHSAAKINETTARPESAASST
jgi:hypothetical protein